MWTVRAIGLSQGDPRQKERRDMRTKRNVVLASLVSFVMVVAFVIPLLPLQSLDGVSAVSDDGHFDMSKLLKKMLKINQPSEEIVITSPVDGQRILIPADSEVTDISLILTANSLYDADKVEYFMPGTGADFSLGSSTNGPDYSVPFNTNIAAFSGDVMNEVGVEHSITAWATVGSKLYASPSVELTIRSLAFDDENDDGIPDNPFTTLDEGDATDQTEIEDGLIIIVASLDDTGMSLDITDPVTGGTVTIVLPLRSGLITALNAAGGNYAPGAKVIVLFQVADALELLFGNDAGMIPQTPNLIAGGKYIEVSLIIDTSTKQLSTPDEFVEIEELPEGQEIEITLDGLDVLAGDEVSLSEYPTIVDDGVVVTVTEGEAWTSVDATAGDGTITASLSSLSLFAPAQDPLVIDSVDPIAGPMAGGTLVTLSGAFFIYDFELNEHITLASVAEAAELYQVEFGDSIATFDDTDGVAMDKDTIDVLTPAHVAGTVDVTVTQLIDGEPTGSSAILPMGFTYANEFTLIMVSDPEPVGDLTPAVGEHIIAVNEVVNIIAAVDAAYSNYEFSHWVGDVADVNLDETTVTMDADQTVTAVFVIPGEGEGEEPGEGEGEVPGEGEGEVPGEGEGEMPGEGEGEVPGEGEGEVPGEGEGEVPGEGEGEVPGEGEGEPGGDDPLEITGVNPDEAWVFGGITVTIEGHGFDGTTVVELGEDTLTANLIDSSTIEVVVPAHAVAGASETLDLVVSETTEEDTADFTYVHYQADEDDASVISTAFELGDSNDIYLDMADDTAKATLTKAPAKTGTLYVIARATNMYQTLGLDAIASGSAIYDGTAPNFDIHAYTIGEDGVIEDTEQDIGPAVLDIPVAAGLLTAADFADAGVSLWRLDSELAYGSPVNTPVLTVDAGDEGSYESVILPGEFKPATGATTSVQARLENSGTYSLRDDAYYEPAGVDVTVANADGEAKGIVGEEITVTSDTGGLGYIDSLVFTAATKAGEITAELKNVGVSEDTFKFIVPDTAKGNYKVAINLPGDNSITKDFEITEPLDLGGLGILLAAILAALGIAAGGDSGGGGGGPCFIATAAYGTPMADQIDTLRALRDTYLLDNVVGTAMVDVYYRVSPAVADIIAKSPVLASVVRMLLTPVIFMSRLVLAMPTMTMLITMIASAMAILRRRRKA